MFGVRSVWLRWRSARETLFTTLREVVILRGVEDLRPQTEINSLKVPAVARCGAGRRFLG